MGIDDVIERMTVLADELRRDGDARLAFHATYLRTTRAVAAALRAGAFEDTDWVDRWDVAFARLYLDALDADRRGDPVPEPWAVAFAAAAAQPDLRAVRHVLLGMNAHINYDLPQALLAVISDAEFEDPAVRARREADHRRIDEVLAVRVGAEDANSAARTRRAWPDRARSSQPGGRRRSRESRAKVWANALELSKARKAGPEAYDARLAQLEKLCGRRVADLVRPGPVLLRLAAGGFGAQLNGGRQRTAHGGGRTSTGSGGLRSFDPVKVGSLETELWVTYYRRQWARFLVASLRVMHGTFGMDWLRTCHGAWLVLRANQLWAPSPGDPDGARRCMTRFSRCCCHTATCRPPARRGWRWTAGGTRSTSRRAATTGRWSPRWPGCTPTCTTPTRRRSARRPSTARSDGHSTSGSPRGDGQPAHRRGAGELIRCYAALRTARTGQRRLPWLPPARDRHGPARPQISGLMSSAASSPSSHAIADTAACWAMAPRSAAVSHGTRSAAVPRPAGTASAAPGPGPPGAVRPPDGQVLHQTP